MAINICIETPDCVCGKKGVWKNGSGAYNSFEDSEPRITITCLCECHNDNIQ